MSFAAALESSTTVNNEVSSAKSLTLHLKSSVRSFMYTRKNRGPKIELWGTPAEIFPQMEHCPFKTVRCFRPLRKLLTRKRSCPEKPQRSSLYRRPSCHTQIIQMLWQYLNTQIEHHKEDCSRRL